MFHRISSSRSIHALCVSISLAVITHGQTIENLESVLVPTDSIAPATFEEPVPPNPSSAAEGPTDELPPPAEQLEELPPTLPVPPSEPEQSRPARNGPIDRTEARSHELGVSGAGVQDGVKIVGLIVGGAAAEAGLLLGDVIESVNGIPVYSATELVQVTRAARSGSPMEINIIRDGKPMAASVQSRMQRSTTRKPPGSSPATSSPATRRPSRRRFLLNTPAIQIETDADVPTGAASTRIRISPPPFAIPSARRSIRISVPAVPPIPAAPIRIRPPFGIAPPVARPFAPPRVIIRRQFGR